jgi:malate dehydrogenase (oxaloacetate-decarboxylating)
MEALDKPVMHDDVHGTAVVTLAAALVACRQAGFELREEVVGQIGLGAAGFGIASLMVDAGARRVLASDPNPASHERARAKGIEIRRSTACSSRNSFAQARRYARWHGRRSAPPVPRRQR